MTDTFTASNGMTVERDHNGDVLLDRTTTPSLYMKDGTALALREFFMHEQGIWIDGESGALALLNHAPIDRRYLSIFMNGTMYGVHEPQPGEGYGSTPQHQVARRFFEAHPERKARPWSEARFITWRNGAYLPQTAQRDLGGMNLGWWYGTGIGDEAWHSEDALAEIIGDADVTVLVTEDAS